MVVLCVAACSKPRMNAGLDDGRYQVVSVTTPGQEGAHCFMQSGGRSYSVATPARVNIMRTTDPLDVTCFKGEHLVGTQKVAPSVAQVESNAGEKCVSCRYPGSIVVAMGINPNSLAVNLTEIK